MAIAAVIVAALLLSGVWALRKFLRAPKAAAPGAVAAGVPDAPSAEETRGLAALREAKPGDPAPARALGEYYRAAGRPISALWAFSFAPGGARSSDAAVAVGMAQALSEGFFPEAAIAALRAVVDREPERREALFLLAELWIRTGKPEEAVDTLGRAAEAIRGSGEGALLEGRAREAAGDAAGAARAYRRAAAAGEPAGWHRLGLLLEARGRRDEARQALDRARRANMTDGRVALDLARVIAAGGMPADREAAMALYRQAVGLGLPAPAYTQSGLLLLSGGQPDLASEGLSRAVAADPGHAPAQAALADLLARQGRRAEAHYRRGLYYSVRDLRARSLEEYLKMAEADPSRPDGLLMASAAAHKMFHKQRARELARRAWERFPDDGRTREQFLSLLVLSQSRSEAVALCEAWRRQEPDALAPLWMLARVALLDRRFEDAIGLYEEALEKSPENAAALESLGLALLDTPGGELLPRAAELLSRAVALAPEKSETRYQLGVALMRQERLEEAQRQLLRSLDLDPHRGEAYNLLVQIARRLRQPGAVALFGARVREVEERLRTELRLWRRTWDRPGEGEGYRELARFLIAMGELVKAESQLEEALRLEPASAEAREQLARLRRLLAVQ